MGYAHARNSSLQLNYRMICITHNFISGSVLVNIDNPKKIIKIDAPKKHVLQERVTEYSLFRPLSCLGFGPKSFASNNSF